MIFLLAEIACGDFSGIGRGDTLGGGQKAWLLPAGDHSVAR
jgi:hypothetical protein